MIVQFLRARSASFFAALFFSIAAGQAGAQTLTPAEEDAQKKFVEQEEAKSRLSIYGWVETGFTGNVDSPKDNQNFGRLFDDRSNEFVMNQAVITAERVLDPKVGFDWGFKLQLLFGTDAHFIHSLGLRNMAVPRQTRHSRRPAADQRVGFLGFGAKHCGSVGWGGVESGAGSC